MSTNHRDQMSRGRWLHRHVSDLAEWSGMTVRALNEIVEGVARVKGRDAAQFVRQHGVQCLHEAIDASDFGPLRDYVLEQLRQPLLAMAVSVGRKFLGWDGDFYVDDYLVLRINFPYEVARRAKVSTENPGSGRLSPPVRAAYNARKIIDPVFDAKSYHGDNPPAAWAHGPHRDSWTGHSRDGRNIWWAIGDVPAEASIVFYPETGEDSLPCDPRTLYLQAGYPVPKSTCQPMAAGEMLIFDPELLHATHLNTTNMTRVAISVRLNASKPTFDPSCFYAREFWRRASEIERGEDKVHFLRREDNLGPPVVAKSIEPRGVLPRIAGVIDPTTGAVRSIPGEAVTVARRVIVEVPPYRVMVVRTKDGLLAYDAACPHNGADLADGGCDEDNIYCPACAVSFDMLTGRSSCEALTLRSHEVWEADGAIQIRIISRGTAAA